MAKRILILFSTFFILVSCAQMGRSGHHVQVAPKENASSIAKKYNLSKDILLAANVGKTFTQGSWIFIPQNRGIIGHHTTDMYKFTESNEIRSVASSSFGIGEFMWPVPSSQRISSYFGKRWGRHHDGIDIPAQTGTHILSTRSGLVVYAGSDLGGYGKIVVIAHPGGYFSVYAHNHKNYVRKGQKVHQGQVIGQVGSTGRSTGPHLHFEIRHNGKAYNPIAFVGNPKKHKGRGIASQ